MPSKPFSAKERAGIEWIRSEYHRYEQHLDPYDRSAFFDMFQGVGNAANAERRARLMVDFKAWFLANCPHYQKRASVAL